MSKSRDTIASRFVRLNQLILGKSNYNIPRKYLIHRDSLLDLFFVLYEEFSKTDMRKERNVAAFVDKVKGLMVELKSLRVNLQDFEVKKIIGRGHFGEVQVVKEKATGDVYAMKILGKEETLSHKNVAFYEEEREIMAKAASPWLTKLQYAFQDNHNLYFIMEFHPGGDMLSLLEKYGNILSEDMCKFYLAELVLAINSVHTMGYVHRDIKPDNILIDLTGHIKLADFGSSAKLNPQKQISSSMPVGTPDYVAPEVLTAMNSGPSMTVSCGIECDWWSLGIVTYEMLFGLTPFANESVLAVYNNIMNFKNSLKFPAEASEISDSLIAVIKGLLMQSSERLGYDQLIVHPLFADIDWNNIRNTLPPYVPVVTSVDDTTNFDDFEPENRASIPKMTYKKEFSGENLPFVGFTYTSPFEAKFERSSSSEISLLSPCSPCDNGSQKKEVKKLHRKLSCLIHSETSMKSELEKLKMNLEAKDKELETNKKETIYLKKIVNEKNAEVKQTKQLLSYEREHRVITENKAAQIVCIMKTRQRQDAIRLKAKSQDYQHDDDRCTVEEQLDEALSRLDGFLGEKVELIQELQDTKISLLTCQKKLTELEHLFAQRDQCNKSFNGEINSENFLSFPVCGKGFKDLVTKLERKNVELDRELEEARCAKTEAEAQVLALKNVVVQLENQLKEKNLDVSSENQCDKSLEAKNGSKVSPKPCTEEEDTVNAVIDKEQGFTVEISDLKEENKDLKSQIQELSDDLKRMKEEIISQKNICSDVTKQLKVKEDALSEVNLDLRISVRKEQQAESMLSSLRERNKELREKIKSLEGIVSQKAEIENELKQQIKTLEHALNTTKEHFTQKEKLFEIEKAKLEERAKILQEACETSKDVNEKFAKSQGQYEEIGKQNMIQNLSKECEEKGKMIADLLEQIKVLRSDILKEKANCAKYEKYKSICAEMEEQHKDFEVIVEFEKKTISELRSANEAQQKEIKKLEEALKFAKSTAITEENKRENLIKYIEELSSQVENQTLLHETELKNLQNDLLYYQKHANDLEQQNTELLKQLSCQDASLKSSSQNVLSLESHLCIIKEEAASHITQIASLKTCNSKLMQALEEAIENQQQAKQNIDELYNELECEKANHIHEKVKLQETLAQQKKLIDFLQSMTEHMDRKKKTNLARFFGKKESTSSSQHFGDVDKLLETERSRCRRLQDELSQTRAENLALRKEINNLTKKSVGNVEVPVSPVSRAMHSAISQSPNANTDFETAVPLSRDLADKFVGSSVMRHKIPHRFVESICMRSTKCCACLDSLHFGRLVAKCQECSIICHRICANSLPSTCGLPSGFMQHFRSTFNESESSDSSDEVSYSLSEGWVKVPKSNKLGWVKRYLQLNGKILYLFENDKETDGNKALITIDANPDLGRIEVTSGVSALELPYAATSDLPFVFKVEYFPHTTCWPQRCLYIMVQSFADKKLWVSSLESLAEDNHSEMDDFRNKSVGKTLWTLKGDKLVDPLCCCILDANIVLLGASDGLYVLNVVNKFTFSLRSKMDGISCVYQLSCLKSIGLLVYIGGDDRKLTLTDLDAVSSIAHESVKCPLTPKPFADLKDCHLFAIEDKNFKDTPYLCVATSGKLLLYQWDCIFKTFSMKKVIEKNELPTVHICCCIQFTHEYMIFGCDTFYKIHLKTCDVKLFLDEKDPTLAGLVYGASQFETFPISIVQISSSSQAEEFLLCFHEMGVFVNGCGKRTRQDLKWRRLPLSFAYQAPYLFITHFKSLEIIEIPPPNVSQTAIQVRIPFEKPEYLGAAHIPHSIYVSSNHGNTLELILVNAEYIGQSVFEEDDTSVASYSSSSSGKESVLQADELDFSFASNPSLEGSMSDHLSST